MHKTTCQLPFARLALSLQLLMAVQSIGWADPPEVDFDTSKPGQVAVAVGGQPVAVYVYEEQGSPITRPYFAHVRVPGGIQVTRNHPPIEGQDLTDHGTYHPGIWLSFGDISGSDYWRLAARTEQVKFVEQPTSEPGRGCFAVLNRYLDQNDPSKVVCQELARYTLAVRPEGYLILWDSTFWSDHEFYFGDQEEMGLGFRVATPLRVDKKSASIPMWGPETERFSTPRGVKMARKSGATPRIGATTVARWKASRSGSRFSATPATSAPAGFTPAIMACWKPTRLAATLLTRAKSAKWWSNRGRNSAFVTACCCTQAPI